MKKCLVVLGMHRSGTSALMRVLNLSGVDIGKDITGKNEDNPTGYWENYNIFTLHQELLARLNITWNNPYTLADNWHEDVDEIKTKISAFIQDEFSQSPLWGFKDPRTCILLDMWLEIFKDLSITPYFVIILRHPKEVALSLQKRDGMTIEQGERLWKFYTEKAEYGTRGYARQFVTYEDILNDGWEPILEKLSILFGIDFTSSNHEEIKAFLDHDLRHHKDWSDTSPLYLKLMKVIVR